MVCRRCGGGPTLPWVRLGLPTIHAFGPFPDHEPVEYVPVVVPDDGVGLGQHGNLQSPG